MILLKVEKTGGKMFNKLQQCVGQNVYIKYWKDGKIIFYEGKLSEVVDYKYIVVDESNFLLFLAANGAIASIKCGENIVYETKYVGDIYEPITEDIEKELERRELACFDAKYKKLLYESSEEYFLKWGRKEILDTSISEWDKFVKDNVQDRSYIVKGVVDIVDMVHRGLSYHTALVETFESAFSFSVDDIEEVNDIIIKFFALTVYEHTDYAIYMLHHAGIKKIEERQNMKQLMNSHNVYVSLT